jgi:hypothetical protein
MKSFKLGKLYLTNGVNNLIATDERFAKFVLNALS